MEKAWQLLLAGSYTVQEIVDTANANWGYQTRSTLNRPPGPLTYSTLYAAFHNPFYAGFVRRNGGSVKGRHEAMISAQQFEAAQVILARRS